MTGVGTFQAIGGFILWALKGFRGKYIDCWKKKYAIDIGVSFVVLPILILFIINACN